MADLISSLQPISPPGVAIHPTYIASRPESLTMKGSWSGRRFTITDSNSMEILKIEGERMSISHRMHVTEAASGQRLCTLRREKFTMTAHYYAEVSEDGPRLFDLEGKLSLGGTKMVVKFPNAAANGQEVELDYKSPAFRSRGELYLNGIMVALLERERLKLKDEFHVHVAPGMDKLLAVCIMACVDDRRDSAASAGAAAGGASGC